MSRTNNNAVFVFERQADRGGRLRSMDKGYVAGRLDPVVPAKVADRLGLRGGETLEVRAPANPRGGSPPSVRLEDVRTIDGRPADDREAGIPFEKLTAIDPREPIRFETPDGPLSMRVVDLMTPIGFGQRGLIVAPPRTGKTILLQQMAAGVAANHPQAHLMMLLIDERPEEVTDMRRTVRGEVVASSNDNDPREHLRLARLMIERAKRMVETGKDVVVFLDSLTRLGRAFNNQARSGGRIMSGGLDSRALTEPKAMFGAARNAEEGGSLTIIATCLIETGSRMDDVIFNEFKGTGNMEIMLSRELANRRLYPAIDLNASGTRKEELLLSPEALEVTHHLRRKGLDLGPVRAMEMLLDTLRKFESNQHFVRAVAVGPR